jgi:hypothetical protein
MKVAYRCCIGYCATAAELLFSMSSLAVLWLSGGG